MFMFVDSLVNVRPLLCSLQGTLVCVVGLFRFGTDAACVPSPASPPAAPCPTSTKANHTIKLTRSPAVTAATSCVTAPRCSSATPAWCATLSVPSGPASDSTAAASGVSAENVNSPPASEVVLRQALSVMSDESWCAFVEGSPSAGV